MSFREAILPAIQVIRNIAVDFGVRRYQAWLRKVTWSGSRVGLGTPTTTDTYLGRPKFRQVRSKDVVAGSVMSEQLFEIGPFTPEHVEPGFTPDTKAEAPSDLSPPQTGTPTEIYYLVKGPGLPAAGALFERVSDSVEKSFRYMVTIKAAGRGA